MTRKNLQNHRNEIDGLRAIAVLPVIFFHAGIPGFSGGFVGVDIFFVISGFLITSILINEIERGEFSLVKFYERRARRILPALFFVMLVCIPFAWAWMLPEQMKDFSQSIVAVILFISNILFFIEVDYFAPAAEAKPLLHTWSLAVEEQFYIFFPLILLTLWHFGFKKAVITTSLLCVVSLAFSEFGAAYMPSANFFLIPSRAWELGAGSLCAMHLFSKGISSNNLYSMLGFILIIFSIIFFTDSTPFPSLYTLLPIIGSCLVLLYASGKTWVNYILSQKLFVGIGLISYSAYLWHQPILAFTRLHFSSELPLPALLGLSLMSLVLAYFSWKYVESPFRKKNRPSFHNKVILSGAALFTIVFLSFGLLGHLSNGYSKRLPQQALNILESKNDQGTYRDCLLGAELRGLGNDTACSIGLVEKESIDFLIVGDSFATALANGIDIAARDLGQRGAILVSSSCPAIIGLGGNFELSLNSCNKLQSTMIEEAKSLGVHRVYLISAWRVLEPENRCSLEHVDCKKPNNIVNNFIKTQLELTLTGFSDAGISPIIIGSPPQAKERVPENIARNIINGFESTEISVTRAEQYPEALEALYSSMSPTLAEYFDLSPYFCNEIVCTIAKDNTPYLWDKGHLTGTMSIQIAPYLKDALL